MPNSTHRTEVLRLGPILPHPNADRLGIVMIFGGYSAVVGLDQWHEGDLAAYVTPDSMVPLERPEFAFLAEPLRYPNRTHHRVRVKKLRGVFSQGLLVQAPAGSVEGDDVAEILGVTHYEPPETLSTGGEAERAMAGDRQIYDLESFRRYPGCLAPGETVVVTEKIHGANARYTWQDGRLWCGSRSQWKREDPDSIWWRIAAMYPGIRALCEAEPGLTLYGEVYGQVQDLRYGKAGVDFAAFDALDPGRGFLRHADLANLCSRFDVPTVPTLHIGAFDLDQVLAFAEGRSTVPGAAHVREGCVVRPVAERWDPQVGRLHLKIVGNGYLERAS